MDNSQDSASSVSIIDQRVEALEERLRDVQARIKELRQIREAVVRDIKGTSGNGSAKPAVHGG